MCVRSNGDKLCFPVKSGKVTTGFWDLRPYSKPVAERTYIHRAWDIANSHNINAPIVAPENGKVFYQLVVRCPLDRGLNLYWPDTGGWYMFSNWFYDTMGAVAVLMGESGRIYAYAHIDANDMFDIMRTYLGISYEWERYAENYNNYTRLIWTVNDMKYVDAGDMIGRIGNAGYSTGNHTHMQVHADRDYNHRIDPAALWPEYGINDNGAGPLHGIRDGLIQPPVDIDPDYMRGC